MLDWVLRKGEHMVRKGYTPEQIINKLREAEILLNQGVPIAEASRKIGVTEQTYYRWRREYGGMRVEQARRLTSWRKRMPVEETKDYHGRAFRILNILDECTRE